MSLLLSRSPLLAALVLGLAGTAALAADVPPSGAKPLSQILEAAHKVQPGVIVSAEFDDGRWEVVSCNAEGRGCREIHLDPRTAKVLRNRRESSFDAPPPAGSQTAAQIASAFEGRQLGAISEIEFDDPVWEVTVGSGTSRAKFDVDPASGEVQRCRGLGCPKR
ncbi:MAG: PepSY domain-containing protein [Burkholderiaceae bacterium]|nr:PepSY domain-containing protein [Burkholderiaceae bacterium]